MGYKNEVTCAIYGDPLEVDALWATHKDVEFDNAALPPRPTSLQREFGAAIRFAEDGPDTKVLLLEGSGWRWYDDYPDVIAWHALMDKALSRGLNVEFVRVGEESGDVDERHEGPDVQGYVGTCVSITCNI